MSAPAVMWFRRDLRLGDLAALAEAVEVGKGRVVPLFVADPFLVRRSGPNRRTFLAAALDALAADLGGRLCLRVGDPAEVVSAVAREAGARVVVVSEDFAPYGRRRDAAVAQRLAESGLELRTSGSAYAHAPGTVVGASGQRLQVFGAYLRAWDHLGWPAPRPAPDFEPVVLQSNTSPALLAADSSAEAPTAAGCLPEWWEGLPLGRAASLPPAGEGAAMAALQRFVDNGLARYADQRDLPGLDGTSRLSAHLRFGCLHPRTVLEAAGTGRGAQRLRAELAWREFYADVLFREPASARQPLQAFGRHLRWDDGPRAQERFRAWARGATGFELVDAAMRQLLAEGWAHNRARMVAASFLVKDLHIDWRLGARWFMWHLVDGDLASNQHGWQWVAGTGTDAAPFHRVFNPLRQQERFDPESAYVRCYLAGTHHPGPIVDHGAERADALARFAEARVLARRPSGG